MNPESCTGFPLAQSRGHSKFRDVDPVQIWKKYISSPARSCCLGLSLATPQNPSQSADVEDFYTLGKLDAAPEGPAESLFACPPWALGISATRTCHYCCKWRHEANHRPSPPPRPGITPGLSGLDVQGADWPRLPGPLVSHPGLAPRGGGQRERHRAQSWGHRGAAAEGSPRGLWRRREVGGASKLGLSEGRAGETASREFCGTGKSGGEGMRGRKELSVPEGLAGERKR